MEKKGHLLLIDGMALLFRSYFATAVSGQFMVNSKGLPTNAIQGFVKHALTAVDHIQPTHTVVCWDMGSQTFRNERYDSYKANRQAPPLELIPQFDQAKIVSEAFSFVNIGVVGYEADDCIGTIAKTHHPDYQVSVVTGDRDLLQLINPSTSVFLLRNGYGNYLPYSTESFFDEKGITPSQLIDVKALMGDSSDGYPGVKGIGEKTAIKLISEYEHIEGVLENLHLLSPSHKKKIENDLDMLHLSRELAEIHCEVPLDFNIDQAKWSDIPSSAWNVVKEMELHVLNRFLQQPRWKTNLV
jgi:5'-3' exonuclease